MEGKYKVLFILFMGWLLVIFLFSNQNAKTSQGLSDNVTRKLIKVVEVVKRKEYSEQEIKNMIKSSRFLIRKNAHFMLYFVLGILSYTLFSDKKLGILIALTLCIVYSISDEIHQLLVYERTARVLDVLIDSCGSLVGILITRLILKLKEVKKCKKLI